jgi:putative ABC transport system permease protein
MAMLVVAVVGVGIGAFGPLYLNGADQSILNGTLTGAPPGALGLTLLPAESPGHAAQLSAASARVPQPNTGTKWFGAPIVTDEAGVDTSAHAQEYAAGLVARTGVCAHLVMVAGVCTSSPGAIVMSTRSAALLGVVSGQMLHLNFSQSRRSADLRLLGLYKATAPTDPYWWGVNYFGFGTRAGTKTALDAVFTSDPTLLRTAPPLLISHMFQVPFTQGSLSADQVPAFRQMLVEYRDLARTRDRVVVSTELPAYLARAATIQHTSTLIIAIVDLELVLLVACVLYFVADRTAAERAPDVRLAVLRGFPPRSTLGVAMAEPLAVVVAAVPIGLLLAWTLLVLSSHALFGTDISSMTLLAVAAAIASGIVAAAAVLFGNRRAMIRGDLDVTEAPLRRSGVLRVVLGTAAVAIAIAAVAELAVSGVANPSGGSTADPLSALAPGLLALAFGLVGARLLQGVLRATHRPRGATAGVAWALASRRVARQVEFGPQIVILALSAGLAVFAISGWAISARNRAVQDGFSVGASRVLTVSVRPGVDFLSAVRAADVSGDSAMAVVVENATDGTTLAVDASRMAKVMSWPARLGAGGAEAAARNLAPRRLAPTVLVSGDAVRVKLDTTQSIQPAPQLAVDLFDNSYQTPQRVELGDVVRGRSTYQASIAGLCPSTCRLADLDITWSPFSSVTESPRIDTVVTSLSTRVRGTWVPVDAGLDKAARWTSPSGAAQLSSSGGELKASASLSPYGTPLEIAPSDAPVELPAVVTPAVAEFNSDVSGSLSIVGLDGGTVNAKSIGLVPALPRVGSASLVDLSTAERLLNGPFVDATTEVWLSEDAPAGIEASLERHGVTTVGTDSLQAREIATQHGGVELAYALFLMAAIAALALALGSTAFAIVVSARMRDTEFAAMRSVGISTRSLRRSVRAEQGLVVGAGLLLGVVAGVVSALVALRTIPEFVALGPGPPLDLSLPVPDLLVTLGTLMAALGLTVVLSSAIVGRRSVVDSLGGEGR